MLATLTPHLWPSASTPSLTVEPQCTLSQFRVRLHANHQNCSSFLAVPLSDRLSSSHPLLTHETDNPCSLRRRGHGSRRGHAGPGAVSVASRAGWGGGGGGEGGNELPEGATEEDAFFMRRAVDLARTALGKTSPNPIVGCVIVRDGEIVGEGFHPKAGEPHAEVFALRQAGKLAKGATAYVSLEPCNHFGRTPPCSQALLRAGVGRVVVGALDPNPLVSGKGVKALRSGGAEVVVGVENALCRRAAEAFMFRVVEKRPFAALRYSMSLDGAVLGVVGPEAAEEGSYYSKLLAEYDAVVVTDAALLTNPTLLSSEPGAKQPLRVVVARTLQVPLEASVFETSAAPTLVVTDEKALVEDVEGAWRQGGGQSRETLLREKGVEVVVVGEELSPSAVLEMCEERDICSVLWDSQGPPGSGLENYLGKWVVREEAVEKVVVEVRPCVVGPEGTGLGFRGGLDGGSQLLGLERMSTYMCGQNVIIEGYFKK